MYTIAALYHFTRFSLIMPPCASRCWSFAARNQSKAPCCWRKRGSTAPLQARAPGSTRFWRISGRLPGCADLEWKEATADHPPFGKMKVRLKKEIVTMGQPDVDPRARVGNYVEPEEWNDLIRSDDVVVIDTRNDYEVAIGTFEGAIDPETASFREFPAWWEENKDRFHNKRVAMFCTGGIRCEKSTNYLLGQGVEDVYHLKGGILRYLEEMPKQDSTWQGECFRVRQPGLSRSRAGRGPSSPVPRLPPPDPA